MIIETLIVGASVSFISYLVFLTDHAKRKREWELEDNKPEPKIKPFFAVCVGTPCPKCLRPAVNPKYSQSGVMISRAEGLLVPTACRTTNCEAAHISHLHVKCDTCLSTIYMYPADNETETDEDDADIEAKEDETIIH